MKILHVKNKMPVIFLWPWYLQNIPLKESIQICSAVAHEDQHTFALSEEMNSKWNWKKPFF